MSVVRLGPSIATKLTIALSSILLMLSNFYGSFDPSGRAFRITNSRTPAPWVNVICNGRYGLVVSQNGGGFSWLDDAQHCVISRWEMDLVRDTSGKFLYISDRDDSKVWSASPSPCQPAYEQYECVHEMGATTFVTQHAGIRTSWTLTVAPDANVEVWKVSITNMTGRSRRLRVSSYFEWCCGVAPDTKREFHKLFITTKHDKARRAIVATKNMWDIPPKSEKDHWNQPWPYAAAHAIAGFAFERDIAIADKTAFLGRYGALHAPLAMDLTRDGQDLSSVGFGRFGDDIAALGGDFTLGPAGSTNDYASMHYLITIGANEAEALSLVDRFASPSTPEETLSAARHAWDLRLAPTVIRSEKPDFDVMNNTWLRYQAISGRLWGRTGYYQQSGARGFRDQLQDSQIWLPLEPSKTRDQILLHASRQFPDGSVNHWWHGLADFGNHTACSDDYLWLPFVAANYIKETGDFACLQREVPFMKSKPEPAHRTRTSAEEAWMRDGLTPGGGTSPTILEHCARSIARALARLSPRGLPYIGSCDWNDGLSAMGVDEKGESVWLAHFLCQVLDEFATILDKMPAAGSGGGRELAALASHYRAQRTALAQAINAHAWDEQGSWYRSATKDSGEWIGASDCTEGRIHLNPQTWSILADTAPRERREAAWDAVKQNLLQPYGPLLLAPAYSTPDPTIGYITRYSPGSRENGGVYMHAATWALMAACKLRDQDTAGKIWKSVCPATRGSDSDRYVAEPFVVPGNVDGPLSPTPGKAGWTWYTGSAAWLNRVCMEWVLGVRPVWTSDGVGLLIDPCPPAELGMVEMTRTWRGCPVRVSFDAKEYQPGANPMMIVDGKKHAGGCVLSSALADAAAGRPIHVEIRWIGDGSGESGRAGRQNVELKPVTLGGAAGVASGVATGGATGGKSQIENQAGGTHIASTQAGRTQA